MEFTPVNAHSASRANVENNEESAVLCNNLKQGI